MAKPRCKTMFRQEFLQRREHIPEALREDKSRLAANRLLEMKEFQSIKVLHAFVPFGSEIDTRPVIEAAWKAGKTVVFPLVTTQNHSLRHLSANSWDDFEKGYAGIPEPKNGRSEVAVTDFDMVLVPGMAYDRYGFRMGYGGGYYDRFLSSTKALRVGLAFNEQIVEAVPHCLHDEQVDVLVTDLEIYHCHVDERPPCPFMDLFPDCSYR